MKTVLLGMLGAALVLAAFIGGAAWGAHDARHAEARPFARYQMQVERDAGSVVVFRLDRVNGQIHYSGAGGSGQVAGYLPEVWPPLDFKPDASPTPTR